MFVYIYIYIYIVCKKSFSKTKCQVSNYFSKTLTLKLKLKWGIILWIGSVRCLTPFPLVTELPSPRSLVRDFALQQNVFLVMKITKDIFFVTKNTDLVTKYEFRL